MKFYWESFKTFFKIGALQPSGGGLWQMIPIIEAEVVEKRKWNRERGVLDLIAIAQSCPGVFCHQHQRLHRLQAPQDTGRVLHGPRHGPALVSHHSAHRHVLPSLHGGGLDSCHVPRHPSGRGGLIAVPTFNLAKRARIGLANCWIPLISALLIWKLGVNPVMIILAAGLGGYVYGRYVKPTE